MHSLTPWGSLAFKESADPLHDIDHQPAFIIRCRYKSLKAPSQAPVATKIPSSINCKAPCCSAYPGSGLLREDLTDQEVTVGL